MILWPVESNKMFQFMLLQGEMRFTANKMILYFHFDDELQQQQSHDKWVAKGKVLSSPHPLPPVLPSWQSPRHEVACGGVRSAETSVPVLTAPGSTQGEGAIKHRDFMGRGCSDSAKGDAWPSLGLTLFARTYVHHKQWLAGYWVPGTGDAETSNPCEPHYL